ncbi:ferritin Dps family protein [Bordetella genomosp. 7]|uniref:Ferritin Dps family protein n=2 Tax=Bordetella genomosp. 7 TaxID=1416805 RepID=A0A261RCZ3_9BORD|nr:ferritin Dps family protein [Bordetella genomosp. 7]OZI25346.1 ferritin Dps family protein [Bordetella genomosp. 7]
MENTVKTGMNRTGMQMAPLQGPTQVKFAAQQGPAPGGPEAALAERVAYAREADRVGSVPIPGTGKGLVTTAASKITGNNPEVLIDKLGQRLAYERSGTRLYEAALVKVQDDLDERMTQLRVDLMAIRNEEEAHFHMLAEVIESLGADPTAQTPGADVSGVAAMGLIQVITDPRTSVPQCLEALLTAELTDHASWELLVDLAQQQGHDDMAARFTDALTAEARHTAVIQQWLRDCLAREAT